MRKYDYKFLEFKNIPGYLVNPITTIYTRKIESNERKKDFNSVFTELENIAIVESIKGSNALEGIYTSDQRLYDIVRNNSNPITHNEKEIAGYKKALNLIHTNHDEIDFSESTIKLLHYYLWSLSNPDEAGVYKTKDNNVVEEYPDGTRRIRFYTVKAEETNQSMEQLVLAYYDARNNSNINPLLLIPCVIFDFLCIHPFNDGNGRVSRLLTLLLLYNNGFDVGKYISFEEQININKFEYYRALEKSSENWHDGLNDYNFFIENFLYTLSQCYVELENRFKTVDGNKINKSSRIEGLLMNSLNSLSKNDIQYMLPDISITTIEIVLANLLKEDKIKKIGSGRSTKYIRK